MQFLGRISPALSLALLCGVALGQEVEATAPSDAPAAPAAPSEDAPSGGPVEAAASATTETTSEGPATTRRRRRRHTKAATGLRGRRARTSAAGSGTSPSTGSLSVGRHNRGRLLRATELTGSEHVRLKHPDSGQHHGTEELVGMLRHAADYVWSGAPGVRLTVGDLSRRSGGRFRPHRSHQSGRDVDVGFYIHDDAGLPIEPPRFFDFREDGTSRHDPTWHFDDARNWALVEAFVTNTLATVQYAFVSRELRRRLLAYAAAHGADPETVARAETVLWQPSRGGRHRDHFHVRIYCDPGDRPRCRDEAPYHPWTRGVSALEARAAAAAAGEVAPPEPEPDADEDEDAEGEDAPAD